jgi:uncharacterized protein (TIGR03437 family)
MCQTARIGLLFLPIWAAWGASSALDFVQFVQDPPTQTGISLGADQNGYLYAVGVTADHNGFSVTPGALNIPPSPQPTAAIYLQKYSPDGTQLLVSALLAEPQLSYLVGAAKVDPSGNIYVAYVYGGNGVAGSPPWQGDPTGRIAVLKVSSGGDKIQYASRVDPDVFVGAIAIALDSDGSTYVGGDTDTNARVLKLDPAGNLTNYSYNFTDTLTPGGVTYEGGGFCIAVLPDHSLYLMASPFLYRLDPTGTTVLSRTNFGYENVQLFGLAADPSGNAYVSGTATSTYAVSSNQIAFSTGFSTREPGLIVKLSPSGSVVFSDLLPVNQVTALAVNATGDVWAGGLSTSGFTLLELDTSGSKLLHYFTLAAISTSVANSQLNVISLDSAGRPMIAGTGTAFSFPGFSQSSANNAFFLRVASSPPQTDLQVSVTASPSEVTIEQTVTYTVKITNAGAAPANDVFVRLPFLAAEFMTGIGPSDVTLCTASGPGVCDDTGTDWIISFPQIAPGANASVVVQFFIPAQLISPLHFPFVVFSSTDDPTQSNNLAAQDVPVVMPSFSLSANISSPLNVEVAGVLGTIPIGCFPGGFGCFNTLPVTAGSPARIYVPTPQWSYSTLYEFASWSDGSTDNPRTFSAGTAPSEIVMRPVTEPWVDPDAGIVQSASYQAGAISPGEIITLGGVNLGPATLQGAQLDSQGRIATEVSGFQVLFDGTPAPIIYTSATQSAVIVPYSVAGKQAVLMTMQYQQLVSSPVSLAVAPAAPGLFTANSAGAGLLAALNSNGSANTRANPVSTGGVIVFFETGEGLTNPTPSDGQIAGSTAPTPQLPVTVTIGGQPAEVLYSGGVPGVTAGVMQVNARVPQSAQPGLLPVVLTIGSYVSQTGAIVAVQ